MAPPIPVSQNLGYGMEYTGYVEFKKAQAEAVAKCKKGKCEDDEGSKED
jgi:hypothetical protein